MEFRAGRAVQVPPPPPHVPAEMMRLLCTQRPAVTAGQRVTPGTLLHEPVPGQPGRLSPAEAVVDSVRPRPGGPSVRYEVVLVPEQGQIATSLPITPPDERTHAAWLAAVSSSGAWDQPGLRGSLPEQLAAIGPGKPAAAVIGVGIDRFPPFADRTSLLESFPEAAALGLKLLGDLLECRAKLLAGRPARRHSQLVRACHDLGVQLIRADNPYPAADPTLVAFAHAGGRKLPRQAGPAEAGLVLVSPWTIIRLGRWITRGRLDVVRPVMIAGVGSADTLRPVWALPGQPLPSLDTRLCGSADRLCSRILLGNPLTGRRVEPAWNESGRAPSLPPDAEVVSLWTPPTQAPPEPCVHCGWCAEVCPTELLPIRLAEAVQRGERPEPLRWCIDCGLCSHVCPSRLPLAQILREGAEHES